MKPRTVRLATLREGQAFLFCPGLMGRGSASPGKRGVVRVAFLPDNGVGVVYGKPHPDSHRRRREQIVFESGELRVQVLP